MLYLLIVIYIVFISLGLPDSLFGVSWPVIHLDFGLPESFASVFSVLVGISTGGVSFISGPLIRKFGTGKVTFFSILLTAAGLIGISLSPNIVFMIIFSVILGYGAGAIDTGLNNFVSLRYKASHMNWLHCFWGVGVTASPIIMSYFLSSENAAWRNGYRTISCLQLIIAALVLVSLKKWKRAENKNAPEAETSEAETHKSFIDIMKTKGVITSVLSLGVYCSMEFLVGTWGATYIVNIFALQPDEAAKWVSLYFGGIMLGRFVSGFISMKLSDNKMIAGGAAVSLLGMVFLALPIGKTALLGLLLIGFGFGPVFPCIIHSVPERFGAEYSADITGYHMGGAYAVGFLTQLAFGFIASATTFYITPFVLIAFCAGLAVLHGVTIKTIKHK